MRFCMISTSFPRWKGDFAGKFVFEFAKSLVLKGHQVNLIAPHQQACKEKEVMDGIIIDRFRYAPEKLEMEYGKWYPHEWVDSTKNFLRYFIRIIFLPILFISGINQVIKENKKNNLDFIVSHWAFPSGLIGLISSKILHKKHIVKIYGGDIIVLTKIPLLRELIKYILKDSFLIISNSEETKKDALKLGISKSKTKVLNDGIFTNQFKAKKSNTRILKKHNLPKGSKIVLSIGRLIPYKGFGFFIKSFKHLDNNKDTYYIIGGKGPLDTKLKQLIDKLGLKEKIILAGFIPEEEMTNYYKSADVYVSSSIVDSKGNREGLGLTIVEAMACARPVIVTDAGAPKDYIQNNTNGIIVREKDPLELAKKITYLLKNKQKAKKLGIEAKKSAKELFDWENITNKFLHYLK